MPLAAQQSYPPDTTAFLYYITPRGKPRIGGELRLRVASSDDYASFESGDDLKSNGQPWSRSLYRLSKYYIPLYEKLREDGLVPDDLHAILSSFPTIVHRGQLLYTLNDTFIVDFSSQGLSFNVITDKGTENGRFHRPFIEKRPRCLTPYTGSALARFERSTLPDHAGTRTVVLRFLRIITPVKCVIPLYDDYIVQPKEGELYRRSRKAIDKLNPPAWRVNIDKSTSQMMRALRLLWDA